VSPEVGEIDEDAIRTALLDELGRGSAVDQYQAGIWRNAQTIQIRRESPLSTRAGKVLPFQMRARAAPAEASSERRS
jgi:hypothetical protein